MQVFLNQQEVNILNAGINAESVNQEKCYILLRDQVYTYRYDEYLVFVLQYLETHSIPHKATTKFNAYIFFR